MIKRKIVYIHEELCNGCELCVQACHEGAIQMVNGKARLLNDKYCDGLGDCLPACPTGAIEIIERDAAAFDEAAVDELLKSLGRTPLYNTVSTPTASTPTATRAFTGCPGMQARNIKEAAPAQDTDNCQTSNDTQRPSQLRQWPIQLNLINPAADYLADADILIAADCTAFA